MTRTITRITYVRTVELAEIESSLTTKKANMLMTEATMIRKHKATNLSKTCPTMTQTIGVILLPARRLTRL